MKKEKLQEQIDESSKLQSPDLSVKELEHKRFRAQTLPKSSKTEAPSTSLVPSLQPTCLSKTSKDAASDTATANYTFVGYGDCRNGSIDWFYSRIKFLNLQCFTSVQCAEACKCAQNIPGVTLRGFSVDNREPTNTKNGNPYCVCNTDPIGNPTVVSQLETACNPDNPYRETTVAGEVITSVGSPATAQCYKYI